MNLQPFELLLERHMLCYLAVPGKASFSFNKPFPCSTSANAGRTLSYMVASIAKNWSARNLARCTSLAGGIFTIHCNFLDELLLSVRVHRNSSPTKLSPFFDPASKLSLEQVAHVVRRNYNYLFIVIIYNHLFVDLPLFLLTLGPEIRFHVRLVVRLFRK